MTGPFHHALGRAPRILFLDGPGSTIVSYQRWRADDNHPGETAVTYSGQLFSVARRLGAKVMAISPIGPAERLDDGDFVIEHRPQPWPNASGAGFYAAQALWAADIMQVALRFRPDVMLLTESPHPFLFTPLKSAGIRLVCALHCTFWPAGFPPTKRMAVRTAAANGWFFRNVCDATLAISPECERQVFELARAPKGPVLPYRPKYGARIAAPRLTPAGRPFRVLFAGRCEPEKGVFDVLELARRLLRKRPGDFHFTICGGGSSQSQVQNQIANARLAEQVTVRGQLEGRELRTEYEGCDAVLMPTTPNFTEGLNKVALEALLAGRPAIMSSTIPAAEMAGDAALVVPAGDLDGFQSALERLADDPALYRRCSDATIPAGEPFVASHITFENVVEQTLRAQLGSLTAAHPPPAPPVTLPS